jgi:cytochrome bd ubiquinol oxidase subunit I
VNDALFLHRIHFAFTITFHYLFPQLTMGLAQLIVVLKTLAIRTDNEAYNWAQFSRLTGGVIGQPLAMEGTFSFFLESAFLGLLLYGEKRLGKWGHWWAGFLVFLGSWISGFFIIVADAWMQHPVAYTRLSNGGFSLSSFWGLLTNSWALIQYAHNMREP